LEGESQRSDRLDRSGKILPKKTTLAGMFLGVITSLVLEDSTLNSKNQQVSSVRT